MTHLFPTAFLCTFLVAAVSYADAKAFYVNCNLIGTRSGENVMEANMLMGSPAINSNRLIRTSKSTYQGEDIIKVRISNLKAYGSVIHFSAGEVMKPAGFDEWTCPSGSGKTNFATMDHGKGVPRQHVVVLRVPSRPPKSITISVLTADGFSAVTRQSKTIFLKSRRLRSPVKACAHVRPIYSPAWNECVINFVEDQPDRPDPGFWYRM